MHFAKFIYNQILLQDITVLPNLGFYSRSVAGALEKNARKSATKLQKAVFQK